MLNKENVKELGSALIIIGIVLTAFSMFYPTAIASGLATIGVDTTAPEHVMPNPYSTDKSSPDQLTLDETIEVITNTGETGSGIASVWVNINGTKHSLSATGDYFTKNTPEYATNWTPSSADTLYTFEFHATDVAGNESVTTTYGKTTAEPAGKLIANGKDVTGEGTVWFKTNDFTFKTKVTQGASIVTNCYLYVDGNKNTMSRVSGTDTWEYSDLLIDGRHTVETTIEWSTGSVTVQGVSFTVGEEGGAEPPISLPTSNEARIGMILGLSLIIVGAGIRTKPELIAE